MIIGLNHVPPDAGNDSRKELKISLIPGAKPTGDGETWTLEQLSRMVRSGRILGHIGRYRQVEGRVSHRRAFPRPFVLTACLRLLARAGCELRADDGEVEAVTAAGVAGRGLRLVADALAWPNVHARLNRLLAELETRNAATLSKSIAAKSPALLVRSDLWLGTTTGGAVAHTAGIANALAQCGAEPILAAYERNPVLAETVTFELLPVPERYWDFKELALLAANLPLLAAVERLVVSRRPAFLYHRSSLLSFGVALAARRHQLPLIIEYNGSEVWIASNWGTRLHHAALAARIEEAVLGAATTIVVVSEALRRELRSRGIADGRVIVAPNGVDCARFRPDLDGAPVRRRFGIDAGEIVIGFIGSFSVWHGLGILTQAFAALVARRTDEFRAPLRLLLIGDGPLFTDIHEQVRQLRLGDRVTLTGQVAQETAAEHLAAADILCAPHVGNADGSEFFGSPTKLFEYMAMGRAIVASRLGQIGEVLEAERTALLVPPGDAAALSGALARLAGDAALRARLGAAAREEAVHRHQWTDRVAAILRHAKAA